MPLAENSKELEWIRRYRLIDDTFMRVVFMNPQCTELLIRYILQNHDLKVLKVESQKELKNLHGCSVVLDILAADTAGTYYDIEVQRADPGAAPKRARYNSSLLDSYISKQKERYEDLAESYVIFITENDYFGEKFPMYHIERVIQETGELFDDNEHIIYVNGQYRGEDSIGDLMHDFFCTDPEEMNYPLLAEQVWYYKNDEKGVRSMCRISEEIWAEGEAKGRAEGEAKGRAEGVKNIMESLHLSFEQACDAMKIAEGSRPKIRELMSQM